MKRCDGISLLILHLPTPSVVERASPDRVPVPPRTDNGMVRPCSSRANVGTDDGAITSRRKTRTDRQRPCCPHNKQAKAAMEKAFTKVPEVTLVFWIIKIAATTL